MSLLDRHEARPLSEQPARGESATEDSHQVTKLARNEDAEMVVQSEQIAESLANERAERQRLIQSLDVLQQREKARVEADSTRREAQAVLDRQRARREADILAEKDKLQSSLAESRRAAEKEARQLREAPTQMEERVHERRDASGGGNPGFPAESTPLDSSRLSTQAVPPPLSHEGRLVVGYWLRFSTPAEDQIVWADGAFQLRVNSAPPISVDGGTRLRIPCNGQRLELRAKPSSPMATVFHAQCTL